MPILKKKYTKSSFYNCINKLYIFTIKHHELCCTIKQNIKSIVINNIYRKWTE